MKRLFETLDALASSGKPMLLGAETLPYRDLVSRMRAFGGYLAANGFAPGARIAVATESDREIACLLLGALSQGVVPVFVDAASKPQEARAVLDAMRAEAVFADAPLVERWGLTGRVWRIVRDKPKLLDRLLRKPKPAGGAATYPACLEGVAPAGPRALPDGDLGLVLYTSGTTGAPKMVALSRGNMLASAEVTAREYAFDAETRLLNLMAATHVDGLITGVVTAALLGSTQIRPARFSIPAIPDLLAAIERHSATHLVAPPAALDLMLRFGRGLVRRSFDLPHFRFTISTAAPLRLALWEALERETARPVVNLYGMSEIGNAFFAGPDEESRAVGTIGLPRGCEARIVEGELLVRGPAVMERYLDGPDPHVVIDGERWFPTGDLARRLASGHHDLIGRKGDLLVIGGLNVHPAEVDTALALHPAVRECATLGVPDEVWGDRLVTFCASEGAGSAELLAHLSAHLSEHKVPRELHLVPELPRGRSCKVQKEALRAMLAQTGAQSPARAEDLEATLLGIAAEVFRTPRAALSLATTPERCSGWDSMAHLELVTRLESTFAVALTPSEVMTLTSLGAALDVVRAKRSPP